MRIKHKKRTIIIICLSLLVLPRLIFTKHFILWHLNDTEREQELAIDFYHDYGWIFTSVEIHIRPKAVYKTINIKEISFEHKGKKRVLLRNLKYDLHVQLGEYGYYAATGFKIIRRFTDLLFWDKWNMKSGSIEDLVVKYVYTFDDEPVRTEYYPYKLNCTPRRLEFPLYFAVSTP